jgi:hypothetical protein
MSLAALATIDDVQAIIGRDLTATQVTAGTRLLDMASGMVRRYTRQTISLVTNEAVTLSGNWTNTLELPQRQVISVSSVTFAGANAPLTTYSLDGSTLILGTGSYMPDFGALSWGNANMSGPAGSTQGIQATGPSWMGPTAKINVVYTHGYADVPQDIVNEVAGMVALQLNAEVGINSEQIGSYKVQYARTGAGGMTLSDETKNVLNFYRRRAVSSPIAPRR